MNSLLPTNYFELLRFEVKETLLSLSITLVLSLLAAIVYSNIKPNSNNTFLFTLIFISIVVCSIMLVIGNNLAGAFGLIGAVSIIRFRTTLKNPEDTTYILFVMAIGVACGFKYYAIAIISTIFISTFIIVFQKLNLIKNSVNNDSYILRINLSSYEGRTLIENYLNQSVINWDIENMKYEKECKLIIEYKITLKKNTPIKDFVKYLFAELKNYFVLLEFKNA